jgi:poly-gamma-glutamate capsule biosynthesis protein CapA/YwtB (metallophosphatase superfamily)
MAVTIGLLGDTMLGRGVAQRLRREPPEALFAPEVVELAHEPDLLIANLECCISERGTPWPDPGKPFFFRAPPVAVGALRHLGVGAVTLANNHALDYGAEALADTLALVGAAGIAVVGAGADVDEARRPALLTVNGLRIAIIGVTDHPDDFAAGPSTPGVAYADLRTGVPAWLTDAVASAAGEAEIVLVTPHWGPNMRDTPLPYVRRAATALVAAGATLVAGHSAHVFQGVDLPVLFDLGDFLDDYAVHPLLRNDLGLLWIVTLEPARVIRVEAVQLRLEFCHTRLANSAERAWIAARFRDACAEFGTEVEEMPEGRLAIG